MQKKLYVHVGTPKTATTSIQQFCAANQEAFKKRNFCYPIFPFKYPDKSINRNAHFLAGRIFDNQGKRCKEEEEKNFKEGIDTIKKLFETYDNVVLSDEGLWIATNLWGADLWDKLVQIGKEAGFTLVIVMYLRRQDEYLTSLWSQFIKQGYMKVSATTWEEWFATAPKERSADYKEKIDRMMAIVGRENLSVRKFSRESFFGGSIYSDFLNALGLELEADFVIPESEKNPSLKGNSIEIRRIINTLPDINHADHKFFKEALMSVSDVSVKDYPCEIMSDEERNAFLSQYREGNREIAKMFFDEDGELFEDPQKSVVKWEKENPYMLDDVIRLIGIITMELREENRRLEKKLKHPFRYIGKSIIRKIKSIGKK